MDLGLVNAARRSIGAGVADADLWGHPDKMSVSEGWRGSWKSRRSKGGCVNFVV